MLFPRPPDSKGNMLSMEKNIQATIITIWSWRHTSARDRQWSPIYTRTSDPLSSVTNEKDKTPCGQHSYYECYATLEQTIFCWETLLLYAPGGYSRTGSQFNVQGRSCICKFVHLSKLIIQSTVSLACYIPEVLKNVEILPCSAVLTGDWKHSAVNTGARLVAGEHTEKIYLGQLMSWEAK